MSTEEAVGGRSFVNELFLASIYKKSQGRTVRQVTCLTIWIVSALMGWRLYEFALKDYSFSDWNVPFAVGETLRYGLPLLIMAIGVWLGYRLVNWPKFADFLIAVEAELNKVSWPGRSELVKASLVVIFTIFFLAILLFSYDLLWQAIFTSLKIS
jgi:preprotein translocase subunit SecE